MPGVRAQAASGLIQDVEARPRSEPETLGQIRPQFAAAGLGKNLSFRIPSPLFGDGLIEAIPAVYTVDIPLV